MKLSIATFNVENLITADKKIYDELKVRYTQEQYSQKIAWIKSQLLKINADIIGFQEVFEEQALKDCLLGTPMENWHLIVADPNGKSPVNAILSKYPIEVSSIIQDIPNKFDFFDDQITTDGVSNINIPITKFSRGVLKCHIKINENLTITVLVLHLKSKRPIFTKDFDSNNADFSQKAEGNIRSLIRRGIEACGVRQLITDEIDLNEHNPIFVLGDLNDNDTAVTNQAILGDEPYFNLPLEQKIKKWKYVLQNSKDIQARKSIENFHYTYIHNGHFESLDNIFISNHFAETNFNRLGRIIDVRLYNDHVIDDKTSKDKKPFYVSDHGQVVVNIDINEIEKLYSFEDLTKGFIDGDVNSIKNTYSFKQYEFYKPYRDDINFDKFDINTIAQHDAKISSLFLKYLSDDNGDLKRKIVGIMGGHAVRRTSNEYKDIANLARFLTKKGLRVMTGGGPGIMEAGHLGAYFSNYTDEKWNEIFNEFITNITKFKNEHNIDIDGVPKESELGEEFIKALYHWFKIAKDLAEKYNSNVGKSIAVTTWAYGEEPVMPFATVYASYFQNSIRESVLVRHARCGMIYAKGGGGTLRELFQDVEENVGPDVKELSNFTPMVFFDRNNFWEDELAKPTDNKLGIITTVKNFIRFRKKDLKFDGIFNEINGINTTPKIVSITNTETETELNRIYELLSDEENFIQVKNNFNKIMNSL